MTSFVRERIYYEIAMSIGNSMDLDLMLKEGLSTYLRKLNCLAGAVLERREDTNGLSYFKPVYAIPKRLKRNSAIRSAIDNLPTQLDRDELVGLLSTLPKVVNVDGNKQYTMDLPGFGLLILVKSNPGLSEPDLHSLTPLNNKLADACRSCVINEQLHREIIERERAEDKFRSIFENSVEGIFQTSLEGRYLEVNPAMARLLGYDSPEQVIEELTDISNQLYVTPADRDRYLNRLMKRHRVSNFETQFYRKDGSIGWCSLSSRLIFNKAGGVSHIEGLFTDITPRMKAMKILRTAKDEAVRLSTMKSSFLSMVSHELRTPLTSILGFAKLTRKQINDLEEAEIINDPKIVRALKRMAGNSDVIIAEGERLTELINNVLDLAKLESGSCQWDMKGVSMNEVLDHSITTSEVLFHGTKVTLMQNVQPALPRVKGDHDRLIQLTLNLLTNAAKFTEEGLVRISAKAEGDHIVVRVTDTGIGVPETEREAIFDKFRQSGNTLTDKPKGTGLGLPICKEIAEYHGGELWLESEEGEGSTFAFSIPVSH